MSSSQEKARRSCSELQQELLEAEGLEVLPPELEEHLRGCPSCQTYRSQLLLLDGVVKEQAPELPDGFELSLRRRLEQTPHSTTRGRSWLRPLLAAAALIAAVAGGLLLASRWSGSSEEQPTYHRLRLAIQSARDFEEVRFEVDLPRGVTPLPKTGRVISHGRDRLVWRSAIREGKNELDLPLEARTAEGQVRIRLSAEGKTWTGSVAFRRGKRRAARGGPLKLALLIGGGGRR